MKKLIIIILAVLVVFIFYIYSQRQKNQAEPITPEVSQPEVMDTQNATNTAPATNGQLEKTIEYKNDQYDFNFSLPLSWNGYSVIKDSWAGNLLDEQEGQATSGPKIIIRHPSWTSKNPRQDIPVMIFTYGQWDLIEQEKLSVSAAPIGPSELGRNAKYVFALPARYNYAFPAGFEEVEKIIESKPLQAF